MLDLDDDILPAPKSAIKSARGEAKAPQAPLEQDLFPDFDLPAPKLAIKNAARERTPQALSPHAHAPTEGQALLRLYYGAITALSRLFPAQTCAQHAQQQQAGF